LTKKRLALAIIDFLNTSAKDGSVAPDDADSIEIATNCIAESFKVDPADSAAMQDAVGAKSLIDIYTVYENLIKGKPTGSGSSASPAGAASTGASSSQPDAKAKEQAEKLKSQGNAAIQKRDYSTAIDFYTQALDLVPLNPIYLSNRAAAYSGSGKHEDAVNDAELAVAADPTFAKAWSRLGFAKYALGDTKGSMEAYKQGIDAEGNGGSDAMRKGYETAKRKVEAEGGDLDNDGNGDDEDIVGRRGPPGGAAGGMPDLASLAGMFGGGAGGSGGQPGMPDFASMMQNPMMRQMAQNMMSDPNAMANLLNNPRLKDMFGGGQGAPDISTLMQDPSIMEM
jgi:small glutamine-rich tetratricopeptide repeat-containing protein alpha